MLYKTLQGGGESRAQSFTWRDLSPKEKETRTNDDLKLTDRKALHDTQFQDKRHLKLYSRFKEKSPNDLKKQLLKGMELSLKRKLAARRFPDQSDFDYGLDKPQTP